jgi:toxin ParE1/3/4
VIGEYRLSNEADADLVSIFQFTVERFGLAQAQNYLISLEEHLDYLLQNPRSGRLQKDIQNNLRSSVFNSHIVFYQVRRDHLFIVRILHHSRDISKHL